MNTYSHPNNDDNLKLLYEASYEGCVEGLISLMRNKDRLILHKISQTSFTETPLHISSSLGHFDFTKILLTHNPKLALELDFSRRTPLHMASAEGHIEIVKELVQVYKEACLFCDEEGRIPLHYAAMRGRIEIAKELIRAKPESLKILDKGKNVLHLCVMYNHLETLKALVELEVDTTELLNQTDMDGNNTILHLALMLKLVQIARYLLSIPKIREAVNTKNGMGLTAHDILEHSPKDLKRFEIQQMFMDKGIETEKREMNNSSPSPTTTSNNNNNNNGVEEAVVRGPRKNGWKMILTSIDNWLISKGEHVEEMRGSLSLVATVISTITFQAAINTPGGFIQQGQALLAIQSPWFRSYLLCNSICFTSSLNVIVLLVSGVPMKNRLAVSWFSPQCLLSLVPVIVLQIQGAFPHCHVAIHLVSQPVVYLLAHRTLLHVAGQGGSWLFHYLWFCLSQPLHFLQKVRNCASQVCIRSKLIVLSQRSRVGKIDFSLSLISHDHVVCLIHGWQGIQIQDLGPNYIIHGIKSHEEL
ncbi:ankyrin repeat-containing protein [Senna tora]|uniref:Ankyrin repeat-containing protein n=1 Tax=Senna tora TaxID=362788 RepID=A0A834XEF1_9FABA|nr:ankyrin repeat-containing protein [Senna tora]